ncbi:polygalacturonase protein [Spatholobus suberectus]|nr:polygalacturonase protein [Spatholobus suberectus]
MMVEKNSGPGILGWFQFQPKTAPFASHRTLFALFLWVVALASISVWQGTISEFLVSEGVPARPPPKLRSVVFCLTEFGGVGDGVTLNTEAFERAVGAISILENKGGGQLNVPPGRWLTAPFNLTSHMTLFLARDSVILAIQASFSFLFFLDEKYWPLMPALPSYGDGREHPGPRYSSLIHGQNLIDVVITGHNGTINGQGQTWWTKFRQKLLNHTRGPLVQILWSSNIVISNITLRDSPFWTLHPYDCQNVTVKNVTILAPVDNAPNTDGIDPDSCEDVLIEDCYISVGDDAIAIKSGWNQYGIAYGKPSRNIVIRNLVVRSNCSSGISIGSEMSGGVHNVLVENILVWESRRGMRIKTAPGRGGYVSQITFRNLMFINVRVGIVIATDYNQHPLDGYDPTVLPILRDISFTSVRGQGVLVPVRIQGTEQILVRNVTFKDMKVGITYKKHHLFQCAFVQGQVIGTIFPAPCENFDQYNEQGQLVKCAASQNVTDIDNDY